ncbi:Uncharacterised protein [Burkholderia pseudomallei]|nr:Uncharacterised protein [Burkholderia pseudomallei]VBS17777.1 Uncharacterised protein [Burkholderia pseudomallei]VCP91333.1 Uncharacterised protein [Burkholderia pseudomallei]VCQ09818.1 Uncharacterised protein [Burkholderia pseudomallei]VCQ11416.1 Uncharacterised protein [Burkholderia pseudomallei]
MHRARPARSSRASSREAATCPRYRVANRRTLARTAQADCGKRAFRGFASFGTRRVIASPARCFLSCRIGHRRLALSVCRLSFVVCRLSFVVRRSSFRTLRSALCVVRCASCVSRSASRVSRSIVCRPPSDIQHPTFIAPRAAFDIRHSTSNAQRQPAPSLTPRKNGLRYPQAVFRVPRIRTEAESASRIRPAASPRQAGWAAVPPSDDGRRAASCCA